MPWPILLLASIVSTAAAMSIAEPKIVIAGAGLHGAALAYYLTKRGEKPLIVERHSVGAAASGKGGGFLARDWGSGPTTQLHKQSFRLHEELAKELGIKSYRRRNVPAASNPRRHSPLYVISPLFCMPPFDGPRLRLCDGSARPQRHARHAIQADDRHLPVARW